MRKEVQPASGEDAPRSHTLSLLHSRCMCPAENPGCRDQPFTILYRDMDVVSGRSVPADIFQMQATTRYPGAYYIFQIKSGNEGREFYMRVRGGGERWALSAAMHCVAWHVLLETGQTAARRGGAKREQKSPGQLGLQGAGSHRFLCGLAILWEPRVLICAMRS